MGTINSQGLEWCRLGHRDKLRQVLELFRVQQLDILTISEMHNSENEKTSFERVYIEETLCIFGSKVGIMLSLAARRAYEAANSRTRILEGRYLAVHLRWSSRDDTGSIAVVATYFPTTVTAAERDVNYMCIEDLIGFATSRWTKQWLAVGDWNMHIGIDKTPDFKQRGPYGLAVPTTVAGKAWMKFMETHDDWTLYDTFKPMKRRGTWKHRCGKWYELDLFLGPKEQQKCVLSIATVAFGQSDHMAKVMTMTLRTDERIVKKRLRRKTKYEELQRQHDKKIEQQNTKTMKLRTDKLGGPTEEAARLRDAYMKGVEQKLEDLLGPELESEDKEKEKRRRMRRKTKDCEVERLKTPECGWQDLCKVLVNVAEQVVGRERPKALGTPWTAADEEVLAKERMGLRVAWEKVREAQGTEEEAELRKLAKSLGSKHKKNKDKARERWIMDAVGELDKAVDQGDLARFYAGLRRMGIGFHQKSREGQEPFTLKEMRDHVEKIGSDPGHVSDETLERGVPKVATDWTLDRPPCDAEVQEALKLMRESAASGDEVTVRMMKLAGRRFQKLLGSLVRSLWCTDPADWEKSVHEGIGIFLHKKGPRNKLDNYRCIMIVSVLSRLVARIVAARVSKHMEEKKIVPARQWGFRKYHSVQGPIFILKCILEQAAGYAPTTVTKNEEGKTVFSGGDEDPVVASMADIKKAYPSVVRNAMFKITRRCGLPERLCRIIEGLHAMTSYTIRSKQGASDAFTLARGLREGDPSSCCLFNMFHANSMRDFTTQAAAEGFPGIELLMKQQGGPRLGKKPRCCAVEGASSENILCIFEMMFADDTNLLTTKSQHQRLENLLESVLLNWGQTVHPDKWDRIICVERSKLPEDEKKLFSEAARFIGAWVTGTAQDRIDVEKRLARARTVWSKLSASLGRMATRDSHKGLLIKAAPQNSLLFGAEVRAWHREHVRMAQVLQNRMVLGALAQKKKEMSDGRVTMVDLRRKLRMDPIWIEIHWRQLRWIGHIARLPDERLEKQMLFAWMDDTKPRTKKISPTLRQQYWKRIEEMYVANGHDKKYAAAQWMEDALVEHGGRWKSMMITWREKAREKEKEDSWEERHRRMDEKRKIRDDGQPKNTRRRLLYKQRVEVHQETVVEETSQVPAIQLRRTAKCDICDNDIPYKGLRKHRTACQARSPAERAQWAIQHIQKQQQYLQQSIERYVARRTTPQQQAVRLLDSGSGNDAAAAASSSAARRPEDDGEPPPPPPHWVPRRKRTKTASHQDEKAYYEYKELARKLEARKEEWAQLRSRNRISGAAQVKKKSVKEGGGGETVLWNRQEKMDEFAELLARNPPDPEMAERSCFGSCHMCSRCRRCREHGACCGGQYLDLGCNECAKCVRCRASITAQTFRLLEEAKARPRKPVLENLPVPTIPRAFTQNPKCWWCSREFDSTRLRNKHVKNCERMPYKMYLARIRVLNPTDCKDCPCDWCGSFFANVRVRANHSRNCLLRQKLAGMKPTRGRVINTHGERCRVAY